MRQLTVVQSSEESHSPCTDCAERPTCRSPCERLRSLVDKEVYSLCARPLFDRAVYVPPELDPREAALQEEEDRIRDRLESLSPAQREVLLRRIREEGPATPREQRLLRAGMERLKEAVLGDHTELAEVLAVEATKRAPKCLSVPCKARAARVNSGKRGTQQQLQGFCAACRETIRNRWYHLQVRGNPWKRTFEDVVATVRRGKTFASTPPTRKGREIAWKGRPKACHSISGHVRRTGKSKDQLRRILDFVGCPKFAPRANPELSVAFVDAAIRKWARWSKLPLSQRLRILARKREQQPCG